MMRNLLIIGLMLLMASSVIFMTGCTPKEPAPPEDNGKEADINGETEDGTTEVVAGKQYACPMSEHPERFTDPDGKCPVCDMPLVEVDDDHDDDGEHGDDDDGDDDHDDGDDHG